jgi:hypothetical protein
MARMALSTGTRLGPYEILEPWLNLIEAWFGILTRKSIRRGSFQTVTSLIRHIGRYIDHWNEDPTPFVWTKEPADIIRKALRGAR